MGCRNAAVFGGLDDYVGRWALLARGKAPHVDAANAIDEMRALFGDYRVLPVPRRQERLAQAQRILSTVSEIPHGVSYVSTKDEACAATGVSDHKEARGNTSFREKYDRSVLERFNGNGDTTSVETPAETQLDNQKPATTSTASGNAAAQSSGSPEGARGSRPQDSQAPAPRCLQKSLRGARGVGPSLARHLERLNLHTIDDALWHLPRRHEDRRHLAKIAEARSGEVVTLTGLLTSVNFVRPRPNLSILKASLSDGSGRIQLVFFNRPYLRSVLKKGLKLLVCGKIERCRYGLQMQSPEFEEMSGDDETLHIGRIVPIYRLTEKLTQRSMRKVMKGVVDDFARLVPEILPVSVRRAQGFMPRSEALRQAHFPDDATVREEALERLIFEELFTMQVGLALRRMESERLPRQARYALDGDAVEAFGSSLPFQLTGAQKRVMRELCCDLTSPIPMSRLVHGDVGSGKTVIAAFAVWAACRSGSQAAIMAPTEILAEQLAHKVQALIGHQYSVRLLTGALGAREKDTLWTGLALGEIDVAVGTHALIQEGVRFARLSMAIVDEQHKFGVVQRATLRGKGYNPDVLVMTATPIPRTLALTVYGDLEVSVIDELPEGRRPIRSFWRTSDKTDAVYQFIEKQLEEGRQAYVVCPLIDASEKLEATSASAEAQVVSRRLPHRHVGLLHGRMRSDEKEHVMERFRAGAFDILVSTTVVEVGVDVPNATVMLVQNADRFGLAQLHQLRGRVGRGEHASYCVFLADPATDEGIERMRVLEATTDGFRIAEEDLKFRGPGEFYGSRQSGLPDMRVADLVRDRKVLERARAAARELVTRDSYLAALECQSLKDEVLRCFRGQLVQLLS